MSNIPIIILSNILIGILVFMTFDVMNTNLDAQINVVIKCNNQLIPFVKKFTLLGVTLDEFLTFDIHTISLCSKVNWKKSILKKSSFLFDLKFRTTLFKLFIMSKYDYCSSLFFYFADITNQDRLEKNYCKALKSYLNINIKGTSIDEKFNKLKSFKLLPLRLRQFQNLVFFIFSLLKSNIMSSLLGGLYIWFMFISFMYIWFMFFHSCIFHS